MSVESGRERGGVLLLVEPSIATPMGPVSPPPPHHTHTQTIKTITITPEKGCVVSLHKNWERNEKMEEVEVLKTRLKGAVSHRPIENEDE
jgi:hypothetical protein